jgi:SAM-dependent methyltransferase
MDERFYDEYFRIEDSHWWFVGRRRIIAAVLDRELGTRNAADRRILDVGCGTGYMLGFLSRWGEVTGADADSTAVAYARGRGVATVCKIERDALPFDDGSFDVVSAFDVLEHVADDGMIIGEMARVLRPGGTAIVTVPAYRLLWGAQDEISHHYRRYARRELRELLVRAGLEINRISSFNTLLFPPIAAIRLTRRLAPRRAHGEPRSDFSMNRPGTINDVLARVLGGEASLVRRINLPFGVSLLALAHRGSGRLVSDAVAA